MLTIGLDLLFWFCRNKQRKIIHMLHTLDFKGWENFTPWCVPTAISLLTGSPVGHMHSRAAMIQNIARKDVKGVFAEEAVLLLREQGYNAVPIDMISRWKTPPSIEKFLAGRSSYEMVMPVMFATNDHMMTAHFGYAADNWTKKPVPIASFPKLNREVVAAWVVSKAK
jgi:hypothetical protein